MHSSFIISEVSRQYSIDIWSIEYFTRESVIYDESLSRMLFILMNGTEKYLLKLHGKYESSHIQQIFEQLSTSGDITIMPVKTCWGKYEANIGKYKWFLFPYRVMNSIKWGSMPLILDRYLELKKLFNTRKIESESSFRKWILKTIFYVVGCSSDLERIITQFLEKQQLEIWLMGYYKSLKDIEFSVIHGSIWEENIYITNDKVTFIDFDNVCLGDPYYDYASLWLMWYSFGTWIWEILDVFSKRIPDFDYHKFLLSGIFVGIKCIQYTHPNDSEMMKKHLESWLQFITDLLQCEQ